MLLYAMELGILPMTEVLGLATNNSTRSRDIATYNK